MSDIKDYEKLKAMILAPGELPIRKVAKLVQKWQTACQQNDDSTIYACTVMADNLIHAFRNDEEQ